MIKYQILNLKKKQQSNESIFGLFFFIKAVTRIVVLEQMCNALKSQNDEHVNATFGHLIDNQELRVNSSGTHLICLYCVLFCVVEFVKITRSVEVARKKKSTHNNDAYGTH